MEPGDSFLHLEEPAIGPYAIASLSILIVFYLHLGLPGDLFPLGFWNFVHSSHFCHYVSALRSRIVEAAYAVVCQ
jgi:hypothetical protein